MENAEIYEYLLQLLKETLEDDSLDESKITMETDVFGELGLNSISGLYVAMAIEDHYGIRISNENAANLRTVGDFIAYIKEHAA